MVYSVTKYGAVGDGATNDAAAIQSAIAACNAAGGGRVVLEGGHTYYSSSIELKSNVELHLEQGALLKAHSDISTYFNPNGDDASVAAVSGAKAVDRPVAKPAYTFIHAKDADNFSITGQGAVDGNVYAFMKRVSRYYFNGDFYPRPTMVYVEHCNHISFHDVTLQNSPFWTLHPAGCNDVLISNIRVLNPLDCTNSDGIDPDHSTNVLAGAAWGFAVLSSANTSSGSGTAGLSGLASGSFSGPGFWTAGASGTLFSGFSASG